MIDTTTIPAPIETVTPIRPSEAIRLGCLKYPVQTFGEEREAGCAVDVLWEGMDYNQSIENYIRAMPCPFGCERTNDLIDGWWNDGEGAMTIAHLNDTHRWSRERIADWLESLGL